MCDKRDTAYASRCFEVCAMIAQALAFKRRRLLPEKQTHVFRTGKRSILQISDVSGRLGRMLRTPVIGSAETLAETACTDLPLSQLAPDRPVQKIIEARVKASSMWKSEDDLRAAALKKLRKIILFEAEASALGSSLISAGSMLTEESEITMTFQHAFAGKATGTLNKRAGSLLAFSEWVWTSMQSSPLRFTEGILYRYLLVLQNKAAAATKGKHTLEALRFLNGIANLRFVDLNEAISARCVGLARQMELTKRILVQASPLTSDQVYALEKLVCESISHSIKIIAGYFLFLLYTVARWSDGMELQELEVNGCEDHVIVLASPAKHKTSVTAEQKRRLLPLVGLGKGLYRKSWAESWFASRSQEGVDQGKHTLPA